ncbi:hypothetical protein ABB37_07013 [Leptomonas pyrrhocoris]|uniref:Uncharacterized protein n=1 Tax=Leptomonas pyrrhocoris TaxID=157538 RepID=A0A0M9FWR6_LEPPY|nr:hypothetical protein ABB37_07013 [Leptomonas pyrrhocoris]KPA77670.1 hypothetical protein ABB37_07013 [Leptomonas pyrrhocoris]|eukprot:XP_015656109.1 hypothetical protein ABB37_07013 [Leptomonas pyrrhocoris]
MHDTARLLPLLEAARKCLISTPWEEDGAAVQQRDSAKVRSPGEPTATAVFCQMLDVHRLYSLLRTAAERQQLNEKAELETKEGVTSPSAYLCASVAAPPLPKQAGSSDALNGRDTRKRAEDGEQITLSSPRNNLDNATAEDRFAAEETHLLRRTHQHYLAVLGDSSSYVRTLFSVHSPQSKTKAKSKRSGKSAADVDVFAAPAVLSSDEDVDVVEVLLALVLCMAAALCSQARRHGQSLQPQGTTSHDPNHNSAKRTGLLSSSRDTSELSQWSSTATARRSSDHLNIHASHVHRAASSDSVYAAVRMHYGVDGDDLAAPNTPSSTTTTNNGEEGAGLRVTLQRVLPLLESRLPMTELWREPSLLAALDVMARGLWQAQSNVHSIAQSQSRSLRRCPLCYAAALNNDLAVEAMAQLNHYYALYHGEDGDPGKHGPYGGDDSRFENSQSQQENRRLKVEAQARGWVAACRIAVWNANKAALLRLTVVPSPPWIADLKLSSPQLPPPLSSTFLWTRQAAVVLQLLWRHWWVAEIKLALNEQKEEATRATSSSSVESLIGRDASRRLRSAQLFLDSLFSSSSGGSANQPLWFGNNSVNMNSGRSACVQGKQDGHAAPTATTAALIWLLSLPLPLKDHDVPTRGDAASSAEAAASGTAIHWMCAHNDVVLLRLFMLHCSSRDPALILPGLEAPQRPPTASSGLPSSGDPNAAALIGKETSQAATERSSRPASDRLFASPPSASRAPLVVQLRDIRNSNDGDVSPSPSRAAAAAFCSTDFPLSTLAATTPRPTRCVPRLLRLLRLGDADGRTALNVACARGHLPCVRLLLSCGLSPNSLSLEAWRTYAATIPPPLLRLLYDPSVLDGAVDCEDRVSLADRLRRTHCPAAAARTLARLAYRLWSEKMQHLGCPTINYDEPITQGDVSVASCEAWHSAYRRCQAAHDRVLRPAMAALAYDPHEPLARLVVLAVLVRMLTTWLTTVPPCIRSGGSAGAEGNSAKSDSGIPFSVAALRELRLQHTVALRLYTQLTCPLGRTILHAAVAMRGALCAAVELREERSAAALLRLSASASASAQIVDPTTSPRDVVETSRDAKRADAAAAAAQENFMGPGEHRQPTGNTATAAPQQQRQCAQLPPSEAATARRDLQVLYDGVLAEVRRLDACLADEQRGVTARMSEGQKYAEDDAAAAFRGGESAFTGVATVLRGHPSHDVADAAEMDVSGAGDVPAYVLVVIPSAVALQRARWGASGSHRDLAPARASPSWVLVEPTLWCAAPSPSYTTPRQVWVQLPRSLPLDQLLREHDGGGYGVVSQDMPLAAPVQRGDLITFQYVKRAGSAAPPQFVAHAIFSEPRTLPYLALAQEPRELSPYMSPPPTSLMLPFPSAQSNGGATRLSPRGLSAASSQMQQLRRATSVTLHACCVPSMYVEGNTAEKQQEHPLDWLQARPATTTTVDAASNEKSAEGNGRPADTDILTVLRTNSTFVSRWSRIVWADLQPCWLASAADASRDNMRSSTDQQRAELGSIADGTSRVSSHHRGTLLLWNLFSTDEEAEEDRADDVAHNFRRQVAGERVLLSVRLASAHDSAATSDDGGHSQPATRWPSRADATTGVVGADAVVDVTL